MSEVSREVVKWVAAVVVLGGVVIYSIQALPDALGNSVEIADDEPTSAASPAATAPVTEPLPDPNLQGPVTDGNVQPTADLSLSASAIAGVADETLVIGSQEGDAVVLSFPLIKGDPDCVGAVILQLAVEEATPTELGVAPSALFDLDTLAEGAAVPGTSLLDPAPGPKSFTNGSPGRLPWDVTTLYRTWASGTPFPGGQAAPAQTPFTLTVRPTAPAAGEREVVFSAKESGADSPTLSWIGLPGCDGSA